MEILQIVYSCNPKNFRGGVSKSAFELSLALSKLGHNVKILTTFHNSKIKENISDFEQINKNLQIYRYDIDNTKTFSSVKLKSKIFECAKTADVIHSHCFYLKPNIYARQCKNKRCKLFYTLHGHIDNKGFNPFTSKDVLKGCIRFLYYKFIEQVNLKNANGIFTLNEFESGICSRLNIPYQRLSNGINLSNTYNVKINNDQNNVRCLFIGRLVKRKRVDLVLKFFRKLKDKYPQATLNILGSGDKNHLIELKCLTKELDLIDSVYYAGHKNEKEKIEYLQNSNIFMNFSDYEGMPMTLVESLSFGLFCFYSKGNYFDHLKDKRLGICIDPNNFDTELLMQIFFNISKYDRFNIAQQFLKKYHNWELLAKQAILFYNNT